MYRRYQSNRKPEARNMAAKYAGKCACCGGDIKAGEWVTYYPPGMMGPNTKGVIGHVGGLEGNGQRCFGELRRRAADRDMPADRDCYPDPGELAEDRWNETHY